MVVEEDLWGEPGTLTRHTRRINRYSVCIRKRKRARYADTASCWDQARGAGRPGIRLRACRLWLWARRI